MTIQLANARIDDKTSFQCVAAKELVTMAQRCELLPVLAALVASLGGFLFGLDIGYISPILECRSFKRDVGHLDNWQSASSTIPPITAGFIVGIFSLGCICTAFPPVSSYFIDELGRRNSIMVGTVIFLTGCLMQAASMSVYSFMLARWLSGTAIGLLSSVVPLYQAEMAPPHVRGTLTSTYNLAITGGIFCGTFIDDFLVNRDGGWRWAILCQTIPAIVILSAMPLLPRSPRWLVQQGRLQEAEAALLTLRTSSEDPESTDAARQELAEIVEEWRATSQSCHKTAWRDLFTGRLGVLVSVGASLQMLQQLVGINAFMYFGTRMAKSFQFDAKVFQTSSMLVNMVMTLPALYLIEAAGRKTLLKAGAAGMMLSCIVLAVLGQLYMGAGEMDSNATSPLSVRIAMAAMVFLFIACFACTWGPVVWTYCAEIFPMRYRARCLGVTTMTNWIGNFLIAQFTPILLAWVGFGTFLIFACFSGLALLLATWLPETRGVSLEQIGPLFDETMAGLGLDDGTAQLGGEKIADGYGTCIEKAD